MILLIIIGTVLLYITGVYGFIYWWTTEHDLYKDDLILGLIVGLVGPFTWLIGFFIHGNKDEISRVLIKKKK